MAQAHLLRVVAWGAAVVALLFSSFPVQAQPDQQAVWITAGSSQPAQPQILTIQASISEVEFKVQTPGLWVSRDDTSSATQVSLEGKTGHEPGGDALPVLRWSVEAPPTTKVTLEILDTHQQTISLPQLGMPGSVSQVQPETCKCADQTSVYQPQNSASATAVLSLAEDYIQRGRRVVVVEIRPTAYNAKQQSILLYNQIHARIVFEPGSAGLSLTGAATLAAQTARKYSFSSLDGLVNQPLNTGGNGFPAPQTAQTGYLILSPDAYLPALQPFVNLKQAQGYTVTLAALSTVGTNQAAIRDYISKAYQNWPAPPAYLLLVGLPDNGADSLPTWGGYASQSATDLYYATMDGADWIPDLLVGRVPAHSLDDVSAFVGRELAIAGLTGNETWLKKSAFLSTCDTTYNADVEKNHLTAIHQFTSPAGFLGTFPTDPQQGGDQLFCVGNGATYNSVQNALAAGRSIVVYSGHGSPSAWEMNINSGSLGALTGSTAMPLVLSYACQSGDFKTNNSIGEVWLKEGGAVGFVGSSADTFWAPDNTLEQAMFSRFFQSGGDTTGGALQAGLAAVEQDYAYMGQYYHEAYNLLGDPSLKIMNPVQKSHMALSTPDAQAEVCTGTSVDLPVNVQVVPFYGQVNSGAISFSVSGLTPGLTTSFAPNMLWAAGLTQLTLKTDPTTQSGTVPLQIQASSIKGVTIDSAVLQLQIASTAPGDPQIQQPAPGSTGQSNRPALKWSAAASASRYDVKIAVDQGFHQIVAEASVLSATSYTPEINLMDGQHYFWQVTAHNACGDSPAAAGDFTVQPTQLSCPAGSTTTTVFSQDFDLNNPVGWQLDPTWQIGLSPADLSTNPSSLSLNVDAPTSPDITQVISPPIPLPSSSDFVLTFWFKTNLEGGSGACSDAAFVEISSDGGQTWQPGTARLVKGSYNGVAASGNSSAGEAAWCGSQQGTRALLDLSEFKGKTVQVRYRLSTDSSGGTSHAFAVDSVQVLACQGLEAGLKVSQPTSVLLGQPGNWVHFDLSVSNQGNADDNPQVMVVQGNWQNRVDMPGSIGPNQTGTARVWVQVPSTATHGEADELIVQVVSQLDPNIQSQANVTVKSAKYIVMLPAVLH